jgi:hypothetical protein
MFVIADKRGEPFFASEPWRNLLPFFEHGNIADASTFFTHKQLLVAKVVSTIKTILVEDCNVSLQVACASDQSLCKVEDGALVQPPEDELLISLLLAETRRDPVLQALCAGKRLTWPVLKGTRSEKDVRFSSCRLPSHIETFLSALPAYG